ncbi:hypothetical protein [Calycomorphotria hydatis]|uniref:Addiction module component n=1 Tax=Calycomorphotria hydatis TaxID=2528027 RepID=A0A517TB14_9PLAN|nr:hypothetical protein [Calycomorphotria hydatis]QDT65559.1 hypothetical protein V22_28140 [Calycomorphotria hydatis]
MISESDFTADDVVDAARRLPTFERIRVATRILQELTDEDSIEVTYAAQETAMSAGWDDPAMDVYDDYDAAKAKS